jgi:hypothetical protein
MAERCEGRAVVLALSRESAAQAGEHVTTTGPTLRHTVIGRL